MDFTTCDDGVDCVCVSMPMNTHCLPLPASGWTILFGVGLVTLIVFAFWVHRTSFKSPISTETIRRRQKLKYFWVIFASNIMAQSLALFSMQRNDTPLETELLVVAVSSICYAVWLCIVMR